MREVRESSTSRSTAYPTTKAQRDESMPSEREHRRSSEGDGPACPAWHGEGGRWTGAVGSQVGEIPRADLMRIRSLGRRMLGDLHVRFGRADGKWIVAGGPQGHTNSGTRR